MGRLCRGGVAWAVVTVLLCFLSGCGGILGDNGQHARVQAGFRFVNGDQSSWVGASKHR